MKTFHLTSHPTTARFFFSVAVFALFASCAQAQGLGDLLVAPTRVILEGRQRTAELTLVNTGSHAATYRISFVQIRMDENGATKEIESPDPGEQFADTLVRYSPRQVVLEPNVSQTVRLQLRKPADLPPGEYRSHLLFRAVPTAEPVDKVTTASPPKELSIKLTPIYGVSIPVIVRNGETSATATLSSLEVLPPTGTETKPILRFRVNRSGNQSVYGNFTVTFTKVTGKSVIVGQASGVAVYTPNPVRAVAIPLLLPPATTLSAGVLRVAYSKREKRDETIAEAELRLP